MFAPPICEDEWRNNAFRSVRSDEDERHPANIARERQRAIKRSAMREQLHNWVQASVGVCPSC